MTKVAAKKGNTLSLTLEDNRLVGQVPKKELATFKQWASASMLKSVLKGNYESLLRATLRVEEFDDTGSFAIQGDKYVLEGTKKLKFEGRKFPQAVLTQRQRELFLKEGPSSYALKEKFPDVYRAASRFSYNRLSVKPAVANVGSVLVLPPALDVDSLLTRMYEVQEDLALAQAEEREQKQRMAPIMEAMWNKIPESEREGATSGLRLFDDDGNRYDFNPIYRYSEKNLGEAFDSLGYSEEDREEVLREAMEWKVDTLAMRRASKESGPDSGLYRLGQKEEVSFEVREV